MSKDDHFPIVGFVWQAYLFSVRVLLTHPVYYGEFYNWPGDKVSIWNTNLSDKQLWLANMEKKCTKD